MINNYQINFFPAVLRIYGYQFSNDKELNEEISMLKREKHSSELLQKLISYRSDIFIYIDNVTTEDILRDIMTSWANYRLSLIYNTSWTDCFKKEISFFCYCLHAKLNQQPFEK